MRSSCITRRGAKPIGIRPAPTTGHGFNAKRPLMRRRASKQMPKDVKAVLGRVLAAHRGVPADQAEALLAQLTKEGRFQEECWA